MLKVVSASHSCILLIALAPAAAAPEFCCSVPGWLHCPPGDVAADPAAAAPPGTWRRRRRRTRRMELHFAAPSMGQAFCALSARQVSRRSAVAAYPDAAALSLNRKKPRAGASPALCCMSWSMAAAVPEPPATTAALPGPLQRSFPHNNPSSVRPLQGSLPAARLPRRPAFSSRRRACDELPVLDAGSDELCTLTTLVEAPGTMCEGIGGLAGSSSPRWAMTSRDSGGSHCSF